MLHLRVLSGQDDGKDLKSAADVVRIGRSPSNDLILTEWHVSGEHAAILFAGDRYVLRDLHSTNGTRVRRGTTTLVLADLPRREAVVEAGDELWLGDPERPVKLALAIPEDDDQTRIVKVRAVAEIAEVEAQVGEDRELLQRLYAAVKA